MNIDFAHFDHLMRRGRFKEAETVLRSLLAKEPDDVGLHLMLSRVLCRMDRPKEAEAVARRAIGLDPESGYPHEVLAEAMLALANHGEAEESLHRAIAIDGHDADRRAMLARIHLERDRHETALEHANEGLALDPDHELCRFYKTHALGRLGRHKEADAMAMALLSDDPDDSANHFARGWTLLERNSISEARLHFQESLRLDPDNEDARLGLARTFQQGNPLLGWLLRLMVAAGRLSFLKIVALALVFGILLPGYMKGQDQPEIVRTIGHVIRTSVMIFVYLSLAANPLFDVILFFSKDGRNALGSHETRAVRWCLAPLLLGLAFLAFWIANGARLFPLAGIGWLSAAVLLHEAFTSRHPWVRRRLLAIGGAACVASLWFSAGPSFVLKPLADQIMIQLKAAGGVSDRKLALKELEPRFKEVIRVRNYAFGYPALLILLIAAYSDEIARFLRRRAPDEPE
jgi:tetratricopeptide (TPR) repeat protein